MSNRNLFRALLAGCFLVLSASVFAEEYHVARNAAGASDANDGLSAVHESGNRGPWKTIQHAAYNVAPGDTVLIHGGDYRKENTGWGGPGYIGLTVSGTSAAPIRFTAAPGSRPLLNTILVRELAWIEISGFRFASSEYKLPEEWRDMPKVVVDDPTVVIDTDLPWSVREADVRRKYATYMGMMDFFLTHYTTGIDVRNSTDIVIRNNNIRRYTFGIQVRDNSSRILIEGNWIGQCVDGIFSWNPQPSITDSVIRKNVIRWCFNNGMQIRQGADNVLIENNCVSHSGTSHISLLAGCTNCTVRNNVGYYGGYYTETMEYPGSSAINVHTSLGGNIVEQNLAAFQLDETGLDGNGFIIDLMLEGNGVLLRNNIAWRNQGSGIRTVDSPNCVIANNTLSENGFNAVNPRAGVGVYLSREPDTDQIIINNIFHRNPAGGIKSFFTIQDQTLIDHNLYDCAEGVPLIWDGWLFDENVYYTVDEIRDGLGWESGGVAAGAGLYTYIPNVTNKPVPWRFRPTPQSPAIDAGMETDWVFDDFIGTPRPQKQAYDIGAYERK